MRSSLGVKLLSTRPVRLSPVDSVLLGKYNRLRTSSTLRPLPAGYSARILLILISGSRGSPKLLFGEEVVLTSTGMGDGNGFPLASRVMLNSPCLNSGVGTTLVFVRVVTKRCPS